MIITKKHLSRRTILRGFGASLALPLLDGMVPALSALSQTAARGVRRMAVVYMPNGMMMPDWTPKGEGAAFEFSPILAPLEAYRDKLVVVSGLADKYGWPQGDEGAGDHARASATFLTGVHAKKTEGSDIQAGISMDQIAAGTLGQETQLASLELALESVELLGACDAGYSCAYANTIAWRSPTTPLPMENDPRAVFERLFGGADTTDAAARLARLERQRSILDSVADKIAALRGGLGARDNAKLAEYLRRSATSNAGFRKPRCRAAGSCRSSSSRRELQEPFEEHARLMFDLLLLAFQTDMTRVATFMLAREVSGRAYPEIGVPDSHHPVSHHQNDPDKLVKLSKINLFHAKQFAYFVERMAAAQDGDGSLLDHSMLLYGAGISDSNVHMHDNLPLVLVGGGAGRIKGGRHVRYPKDTPVTNLFLNMLDKLGVPADRIGDSTGRLEYLSEV